MAMLTIHLFGRLDIRTGADPVASLESRKAQELLAYLLLHRDRAHTREALATLFWADASPAKGRKYLRQALWRLHTAVEPVSPRPLLAADGDWLRIHAQAEVWLDVAEFESAYTALNGQAQPGPTPANGAATGGSSIQPGEAERLEAALALYQGDLLDGWYDEWCLFERERLQGMYIDLLDRRIDHALSTNDYAVGIHTAQRLLVVDPARERTHRRLMKLYWLSGDRTSAMRQYQRCTAVLERELGVAPSDSTQALYGQICASEPSPAPQTTLSQLLTFRTLLTDVQSQVQADITRLEHLLGQHGPGASRS